MDPLCGRTDQLHCTTSASELLRRCSLPAGNIYIYISLGKWTQKDDSFWEFF